MDSRINFNELINNLEVGIFRYSLDAKGRFLFLNSTLARMLGRKVEDILHMNFLDICEDPDEFSRMNTKICSEGSIKNEWVKFKTHEGKIIQGSLNAVLTKNQEGKDLLIDGIVEDITAHKKAREGLLQAKLAAEEASTAKSMFLANMSHEVRTPMNAVIGMLDLTLETDLTEDQKDNLETAKEAADNLLSLLNDILDISRVEAGKVTLESVEFNLWKLVESVTRGLSVLANKKNIQLNCHIDEKVPKIVLADSTRIRQIIINLVNNAIKFTHEGRVEIRVEVGAFSGSDALLTFSVSDTGIGIPKDKQDAIFEIFTQADDSTTRKFGGTGLGLAICKRLVEMMDGRIWIESEEGTGSTFFFTARLKVKLGDDGAAAEPSKRKLPLIKETSAKGLRILNILLAEDNKLNQKIATKLLEKRGWLVEVVENGQEALDRAGEKNFDIILIDVQMPVLDGLEATRIFRKQESETGKHIPIVAMTAKAMVEDKTKCLEAGMDAYLSKPIDAITVYETIEQVLEKGDS
ncbi:MAG: ATP-binding protein [Candidatus Aceula meridiana]|nr:ATP-binding protein [Candidatus Aceula meridiana]